MNFKNIIKILQTPSPSFSNVKMPLGRWNIHNYSQTILKIKYANEDNCGICCKNKKNIKEIPENNELDDDNKYIYMMGYESIPE